MDARLIGTFTAKSPISHIGESIGTTSYLVQEPILQDDGEVEEVFAYSGNAWRGQLRDLAAAYLLDSLGGVAVKPDTFALLFSGGKIGGEQGVYLEEARAARSTLPILAVWGGGVRNQILPGKMRVGNSYPVCQEAAPVLRYSSPGRVSYRQLTTEKSFSRKDDSKDDRLLGYLALPEPEVGQISLLADPDEGRAKKGKKAERKDGEVADQMRMTSELLIAGTRLETWIDLQNVTEVELGCVVSALHRFARSPHIGGQANKGHGLVDLHYDIINLDTGEAVPFLDVRAGECLLEPVAEGAKESYDRYVKSLYDQMLAENRTEIVAMLGAA